MADDFNWLPLLQVAAQAANSYGTGAVANDQIQAAYDEMLRNIQSRFSDYDKLGTAGYQDIAPQQVGQSGLGAIPTDAESRAQQQAAMAALDNIANSGGLNLGDMNAINQTEGALNRNEQARQASLANQFAARGQLGSGAQLAMALSGQQNAAQSANQRAEGVAAQAQQRALQALLEKAHMAQSMGNDDYRRKADAARANDAIEARNAAARTDAGKYNNSLRGQAYEDALRQAQGKTSLTNSMNQVVFGKGEANRNTTLGMGQTTNRLIGSAGQFGQGSGGSTTPATESGTQYDDGYTQDDEELNRNDDD